MRPGTAACTRNHPDDSGQTRPMLEPSAENLSHQSACSPHPVFQRHLVAKHRRVITMNQQFQGTSKPEASSSISSNGKHRAALDLSISYDLDGERPEVLN